MDYMSEPSTKSDVTLRLRTLVNTILVVSLQYVYVYDKVYVYEL